jgi:Ni,Fe-hydrogenase III component G
MVIRGLTMQINEYSVEMIKAKYNVDVNVYAPIKDGSIPVQIGENGDNEKYERAIYAFLTVPEAKKLIEALNKMIYAEKKEV